MSGKIRIKFGPIEVDCEGSEEFLKGEFLDLLKAVSQLAKESGVRVDQNIAGDAPTSILLKQMGIGTVAQKLSVSTGSGLAIAVAVKFTLIDGKEKFSSKEISADMRKASGFFKETYGKNLSNTLKALVKSGELHDAGSSLFSLPADKHQEFKSKLNG